MPIKVRADVIDIRQDRPRPDDSFLVDTNVWYWLTYTRASHTSDSPRNYQLRDYPAYLLRAKSVRAQVYWCGLSLEELAHRIERIELKIFNKTLSQGEIKLKEFRHDRPEDRKRVVEEIQAAWGQVKTMAEGLAISIDQLTTDAAFNMIPSSEMDGYDLFMVQVLWKHSVRGLITDDADLATVSGVTIFTSNRKLITEARKQKKLRQR